MPVICFLALNLGVFTTLMLKFWENSDFSDYRFLPTIVGKLSVITEKLSEVLIIGRCAISQRSFVQNFISNGQIFVKIW